MCIAWVRVTCKAETHCLVDRRKTSCRDPDGFSVVDQLKCGRMYSNLENNMAGGQRISCSLSRCSGRSGTSNRFLISKRAPRYFLCNCQPIWRISALLPLDASVSEFLTSILMAAPPAAFSTSVWLNFSDVGSL